VKAKTVPDAATVAAGADCGLREADAGFGGGSAHRWSQCASTGVRRIGGRSALATVLLVWMGLELTSDYICYVNLPVSPGFNLT
jgi:hypothetical protein